LQRKQRPDGAWVPLWFGNQFAINEENPVYGTSRVLIALNQVQPRSEMADRAADWLVAAQNHDGGWGGDRMISSTIEETSVAVAALCGASRECAAVAVGRGTAWIVESTRGGDGTSPSPIGFYFAKLWYYERLYPLIFAADAMARGAHVTRI
jgi:squalene-hopene/tetraprenyl-beta-curcumene cyclase